MLVLIEQVHFNLYGQGLLRLGVSMLPANWICAAAAMIWCFGS